MRERLRLGAVTGICIVGLVLRNGYVEQFSRSRDAIGPDAAGEQAVVADAVTAVAVSDAVRPRLSKYAIYRYKSGLSP